MYKVLRQYLVIRTNSFIQLIIKKYVFNVRQDVRENTTQFLILVSYKNVISTMKIIKLMRWFSDISEIKIGKSTGN